MIDAEIVVDTRRKTKKGYPVKIRIKDKPYKYVHLKLYSATKKLKYTDFLRTREIQLLKELDYCNKNKLTVDQSIKIFENGISENVEDQIYLLKKKLNELQNLSGVGILEFFKVRIKEKTELKESVRAYKDTFSQFEIFLLNKDMNMNNITYEWLNSFIIYKKKNGCADGGIYTYLKNLKAVYREAQKRESLNIKSSDPFKGLIKKSTKKPDYPHTPEQLKKLFNFQGKPGTTKINLFKSKRNIDIWLLQFCLGGIDYCDIALLEWKNIKDNRVNFYRHKNRKNAGGGVVVSLLLSEFAKEVIEKYGNKKRNRIFSFIPDPKDEDIYHQFTGNINRSLKKICQHLEIPILRTKASRYLFNSFAYELLIHESIVEQIQGHKSVKVTQGYNRGTSYEVIDIEHKKVLDLLFE